MINIKLSFKLLILLIIILSGCGEQKVDPSVALTGEFKEFDIEAKNWEFTPNTIEVNLGDRVDLHLQSIEGTHGFKLPEFRVAERLPQGKDIHTSFIADKKGEFSFSCSVPCGSGHGGMRGKLIVK